MKSQTEYYINVYKWRDLPQGIYTIWSEEDAAKSIDDAIRDHNLVVESYNTDFEKAEYLTTHTHDGEIDIRDYIQDDEEEEDDEPRVSYSYLAPLSDKGEY